MSNPYAGSNAFPATVAVVDDGDPPAAATWAPALEGLADRTVYLLSRVLPAGIAEFKFDAATPASEITVNDDSIDSTGLYVDLPGVNQLALTTLEDPDLIVVGARIKLKNEDASPGSLGIQIVDLNGDVMPGARVEQASAVGQTHELVIMGMRQNVASVVADAFKVQAFTSGLDVDWIGSWHFFAFAIRFNP